MTGISLPTRRETAVIIPVVLLWLAVTSLCVGFRPEHLYIAGTLTVLLFITATSRRFVVAMLPFAVFAISYDWMNIVPNYEVNPVDIRDLYDCEKNLFGIASAAGTLTPNEFFAANGCRFMDFMSGLFYLCWVPVPILFGIWLYFKRQYPVYLHFSLVFLLVNFIGFGIYYIHPAAPPWYVASHGFDFIVGTPGEVAGLGKWDEMTGLSVFHWLYSRNANVFAAMPSLHAAYMLIAFLYSLRARCSNWLRALFAFICLGIWFTAVYTSHHYILDVLAGIGCTLVGYGLFEYVLMKIPAFARFMRAYAGYIASPSSPDGK